MRRPALLGALVVLALVPRCLRSLRPPVTCTTPCGMRLIGNGGACEDFVMAEERALYELGHLPILAGRNLCAEVAGIGVQIVPDLAKAFPNMAGTLERGQWQGKDVVLLDSPDWYLNALTHELAHHFLPDATHGDFQVLGVYAAVTRASLGRQ